VFYDHTNGGAIVEKNDVKKLMTMTSHFVVYIPTKKLLQQLIPKAKANLVTVGDAVEAGKYTSSEELILMNKKRKAVSGMSGTSFKFDVMIEKMIYKELCDHTVERVHGENIFMYLNKHVNKDKMLREGWKQQSRRVRHKVE